MAVNRQGLLDFVILALTQTLTVTLNLSTVIFSMCTHGEQRVHGK